MRWDGLGLAVLVVALCPACRSPEQIAQEREAALEYAQNSETQNPVALRLYQEFEQGRQDYEDDFYFDRERADIEDLEDDPVTWLALTVISKELIHKIEGHLADNPRPPKVAEGLRAQQVTPGMSVNEIHMFAPYIKPKRTRESRDALGRHEHWEMYPDSEFTSLYFLDGILQSFYKDDRERVARSFRDYFGF